MPPLSARVPPRAAVVEAFFSYVQGENNFGFNALAIEEKNAMSRVAKCLAAPTEGDVGPLARPEYRLEWDLPTEETWSAIRANYPVLDRLTDEELAAIVAEVKVKQA